MQTRRLHRDPVAVRAVHCVHVSVHSKVRPVIVFLFLNLTMFLVFVLRPLSKASDTNKLDIHG